MIFEVIWRAAAENELADSWMNSNDRDAVTMPVQPRIEFWRSKDRRQANPASDIGGSPTKRLSESTSSRPSASPKSSSSTSGNTADLPTAMVAAIRHRR